MCRSTGLKMSKETLLRCKVDDQIRLFDSAGSKILKLLTQCGGHCGQSNTVLFEVYNYHKLPARFAILNLNRSNFCLTQKTLPNWQEFGIQVTGHDEAWIWLWDFWFFVYLLRVFFFKGSLV